METMTTTELLYWEAFSLLTAHGKVMATETTNGRTAVILEATIFHPQGGGQPYDKGVIEGANATFAVEEVRLVDGVVHHIGKFDHGDFAQGEAVTCRVDEERRRLNSRLHSAGHAVDWAVMTANLNWIPGKGYHFPDGPYVEYTSNLEGLELDRESLRTELETLCNRLVAEDREVSVRFMSKEEMASVCHFVPDYIPEGKPARVVFFGDFGVPCGGTHVTHLAEIGRITIRKVRIQGNTAKVSYDVVR
ncbi:MAG: hypothetical protein HY459_04400 [Parcubacteria group bacterium]|nr:hypothetical protein [Parcubacteria group bacterium]